MGKQYWVYILASRKYGALYIGVTGDLVGRVYVHRAKLVASHTTRYNIHQLVYFEECGAPDAAILREKQLKKWNRSWKLELIEQFNPHWRDLYAQIAGLEEG